MTWFGSGMGVFVGVGVIVLVGDWVAVEVQVGETAGVVLAVAVEVSVNVEDRRLSSVTGVEGLIPAVECTSVLQPTRIKPINRITSRVVR
jgi:negative regulator of sigma E activity